jgi:hypothetical protein
MRHTRHDWARNVEPAATWCRRTWRLAGGSLAVGVLACSASGSAPAGDGPADGAGPGDGAGSGSGDGGGNGVPTLPGDVGSIPGVGGERPAGEDGLPAVSGGTDFTGFDLDGSEAEPGAGCQQAARTFIPQIPTVFMLVDRSGTMFQPNAGGTTSFSALRAGALEVIAELEGEVRFGFGAFSGSAGGQCPLMPSEDPKLENHADIATLFNSLEQPIDSKETPTLLAMRQVADVLWADDTEGAKYILFVTDGEPDYCDDGSALCPADSVVGLLQQLALGLDETGAQNEPINTFVFGIETPQTDIAPEILQAFANAGSGQPVAPLAAAENQLFYECQGRPGWVAELALSGKPLVLGQTTGQYAPVGGTATVYRPDPTDQAALTNQIRSALAGVKSCTFDLEGDVEVDVNRSDLGNLARVLLNGEPVAFDAANGWRMLTATTVQLEGAACEAWREPVETSIDFDFPCDVIVVR